MERGKLLGRWLLWWPGYSLLWTLALVSIASSNCICHWNILSGFSESLVSFMEVFNGAGAAWNNIRFLYAALGLVSVCAALPAAVSLSWVPRAAL